MMKKLSEWKENRQKRKEADEIRKRQEEELDRFQAILVRSKQERIYSVQGLERWRYEIHHHPLIEYSTRSCLNHRDGVTTKFHEVWRDDKKAYKYLGTNREICLGEWMEEDVAKNIMYQMALFDAQKLARDRIPVIDMVPSDTLRYRTHKKD